MWDRVGGLMRCHFTICHTFSLQYMQFEAVCKLPIKHLYFIVYTKPGNSTLRLPRVNLGDCVNTYLKTYVLQTIHVLLITARVM